MSISFPPATSTVSTRLTRQIILLSAAAFASTLSTRISDPVLPQLANSFAITIGEAAQVVSAYAFAYGILLLIYGPVADRYGKYRIVTFAALASVIGALGSAIAINLEWLIAFRILNGATAGALIPMSMAWIGDNVPYEKRQPVLAAFLTGQILGLIGGQAMGGFLADVAGWRSVFYFQCITYLIVGIFLLIEIRHSRDIDRRAEPQKKDIPFFGQIFAIILSYWSRQVLFTVFAEGIFLFSALAFVPSFLHKQFGISLTVAGASMGLFGIGGLCYTVFARFFVARLGERGLALIGGALLSLAFGTLIFADRWQWIWPAAWCAGFGYYMLHNTLQTNATQMAPYARGTAVSLFASCFFTGQSIGVWLAAIVVDSVGYYPVFWAAAISLPVIGVIFSNRIKNRAEKIGSAK